MSKKVSLVEDSFSFGSVSSLDTPCMDQNVVGSSEYNDKNEFLKLTGSTNSNLLINVEQDNMMERIRQENRERKKRWRQANEDRNKDNDLRCRVNKRAHKLYGKEQSIAKSKWIETEFLKRQLKRKDRERLRSLESHMMTSSNHNIDNTSFDPVEFSQTFLTNLSQNLIAFNHTIPFSLRSALSSFSTNPNFLKIIRTLFTSFTNKIPSTSLTSSSFEDFSLSHDETTTQLYRSLLSNFLPTNHESSVFSPSSASFSSENIRDIQNNDQIDLSITDPSSSTTSQPSTSQFSHHTSSESSLTYKSYDPVTSLGFPPAPIDFKDH